MWKENKVELGRRAATLSPLSFLSFRRVSLLAASVHFLLLLLLLFFFFFLSSSYFLLLFFFFFFGFFFFSSSEAGVAEAGRCVAERPEDVQEHAPVEPGGHLRSPRSMRVLLAERLPTFLGQWRPALVRESGYGPNRCW